MATNESDAALNKMVKFALRSDNSMKLDELKLVRDRKKVRMLNDWVESVSSRNSLEGIH